MARRSLLMVIVAALLGAAALAASANVLMTQQGRLTDASGNPLPDGDYQVTFCLYPDPVGPLLWSEIHTVPLKDGLFSVNLGEITPLSEDLIASIPGAGVYLDNLERHMSVKVTGYPELPRVRLTGVPYAAVATRMTGDVETGPGELLIRGPGPLDDYSELTAAGFYMFDISLGHSGGIDIPPLGGRPRVFLDDDASPGAPNNSVLITPEGMGCDFDEDGNWNFIYDEVGLYCDLGDDGSADLELYSFTPNVPHAPAFFTTAPNTTCDLLGPANFGNRTRIDLCPAQPGFEIDFVNGTPPCNGARADFKVPVNITGNMAVTGNQTVSGTKSFVQDHPMLPDKQIVYVSLEGNEAGTYTRGSGRLAAGSAEVTLPEDFGFVTGVEGLTAQITPRGPVQAMLYVESITPRRLVVRASSSADREVPFDFLVQGVRLGYENHQVIRDKPLPPAPDPDYSKQIPPSPRHPRTFGTPGR